MVSEVHFSVHPNRHHHILFAKFNLKIHFPLLYERLKVDQKANADHIRREINNFLCINRFTNTDVSEQVCLFTKTTQNNA